MELMVHGFEKVFDHMDELIVYEAESKQGLEGCN